MKITALFLVSLFGQEKLAVDPKDEKIKEQAALIAWYVEHEKVLSDKINALTGLLNAQINQEKLEAQKPAVKP